ncbi:MAG TPA: DUF502 domain-containing protein [Chitinophagaceae bacterium]|nr:DUF502 domain-containing protein [Chitinophagaceae bacterium]
MRRLAKLLLRSFLQGLVVVGPAAVTAYVIYLVFDNVDTLIPFKLPRGLGFLIVISCVTIVGYLGTRFFFAKLIDGFNHLLEHTPGIKHIYSSVKDIMGSFVGDKRKFNRPVWVRVNTNPEIWRIGFLTQKSMEPMGMEDKVAVYMPHAYAISGWVIVIDKSETRPVTKMDAAEAMKFVVSGGVTFSEDHTR